MYRLVVILMIVSLSGNKAAGSEQEWDIFGGDYQNQKYEPLKSEGNPLYWADQQMELRIASMKPGEFNEFEVAKKLAEEPIVLEKIAGEQRRDYYSERMIRIFLRFSELKSIDSGIKNNNIICEEEISKIENVAKSLNDGLLGRLHETKGPMDIDSFFFKRASEISKEFFTRCMKEKVSEFYLKRSKLIKDDPELEEAFRQMSVFDIFIDTEKVAQRPELPRYCNGENQIIDMKNYWSLVHKIGAQAGKEPEIWLGNIGLYKRKERREMMSEFFARTCRHEKFDPLRDSVEFIMLAKKSKLNRGWNSMFFCGEEMGRFQLCEQVWESIGESRVR